MTRLRPLHTLWFLVLVSLAGGLRAQADPPNGPRVVDPRWHALRGATLVAAPGEKIENATIVLRDGIVVSVAADAEPPAGARVWDCQGLWVYAGLIEPYLPVEVPSLETDAKQAHWNRKVMPQRSALDASGVNEKTREELRALGFAAAAVAPSGGVFRGRGALVLLEDPSEAEGIRTTSVVRRDAFDTVAFDRGGEGYPRSLMGCVALTRQALFDADWYAHNQAVYASYPHGHEAPSQNAALAALGSREEERWPLLFEASDELEALVALRVASEFGRPCLIVGSGTEYRRLAAFAAANARLIVPLAFPDVPGVTTLSEAERVSLRELMSWEQAPTNPRRLADAGLAVALTTHRAAKRADFMPNLREAIRHGLSDDDALAMLTTNPAEMLGVGDRLGRVQVGAVANLVVSDGPLFGAKTKVRDVWVRGQRHVVHDPSSETLTGTWALTSEAYPAFDGSLVVAGAKKISLKKGEVVVKGGKAKVGANALDFLLDGADLEHPGVFAMRAVHEGDHLHGTARSPDGRRFTWTATRDADADVEDERDDAEEPVDVGDVPEKLPVPLGAFGSLELPRQQNLIFRNATLWGVEPTGRVDDATLIISGGKIMLLGPNDSAPKLQGYEVIDCTGKHITPGLIDCHSHTGISKGVNEGTQAVTSEVRIFDALNADDVNWYRQLAGGVTAVQQLHGSANPIGGQSNIVKLRWGVQNPAEMNFRGAKPAIKFALGENVKRSNSRGPRTGPARYPTTRMGVEALMRDRFLAAREYAQAWQRYRRLLPEPRKRAMQPRRDLELDALVEILSGVRMVHCHSYRQDEILMLCRLAQEFGFKVGAFQHGLEAYKVGEAIKKVAIGASVFSDWWAYKFEVFDAIPHNGAILRKLGITVSFNSDSSELARRLNTEAAKAVKYGGLDANMALSFVTLGPASQLGVDRRVGSLMVGKDADIAIWSGDPLSTYSRCVATYIDGRPYFTLEKDAELRAVAKSERERLLQKALTHPAQGKSKDGEGDADGRAPRVGAEDFGEPPPPDHPGVCGCETRRIAR